MYLNLFSRLGQVDFNQPLGRLIALPLLAEWLNVDLSVIFTDLLRYLNSLGAVICSNLEASRWRKFTDQKMLFNAVFYFRSDLTFM